MSSFANIKKFCEDYAKRVQNEYRAKLGDYKISRTVKAFVVVATDSISVLLTRAIYWKYIERGRRAGAKFPPKDVISRWITEKGIQPRDLSIKHNQLVFLISRKIARDGIKPKPYLQEVLTERKKDVGEFNKAFDTDIEEYSNEVINWTK